MPAYTAAGRTVASLHRGNRRSPEGRPAIRCKPLKQWDRVKDDIRTEPNSNAGFFFSGAGGQVDFVRGAYAAKGGKSLIVLNSTAADGAVSRIVSRLHGPVTTSRMDVDWEVTEHGAACLKGKSEAEPAEALIAIAAPHFRDQLRDEATRQVWA